MAALLFAILLWTLPAAAHVGSPDVYAEGNAGPYRLFVTVRPPLVIPGIAEIEVRNEAAVSNPASVDGIQIAPIPLTGEASKHPPVADPMKQSAQDKQFFTAGLWIMASGSWQIRFTVSGSQGAGVLSIPVPATASATRGMQWQLGLILSVLGLLLVAGVIGIVGAAARDAQLPAGAEPSPSSRRRAAIAMGVALVLTVGGVIFGKVWWNGEADDYGRYVYKPLTMQATLDPALQSSGGAPALHLKIEDPGWLKARKIDDFVLDHDHLMHLYLLREPGLDLVFHLHPEQTGPGEFDLKLPSIPAGNYRLYADVVHATGFPETLVSAMTLPEIHGRALTGDDAQGFALPVTETATASCPADGSRAAPQFTRLVATRLPDGYSMVWNNSATLPAKTAQIFSFSLLDPGGKVPENMSLYMGMLGHAAFVKTDGTVFAHVHPSGTVSMAALMMAAAQNAPASTPGSTSPEPMAVTPGMPGMIAATGKQRGEVAGTQLPNVVGFPYGFPTPGRYRIFVQMKHGETIETAAFDACAGPSALTPGS